MQLAPDNTNLLAWTPITFLLQKHLHNGKLRNRVNFEYNASPTKRCYNTMLQHQTLHTLKTIVFEDFSNEKSQTKSRIFFFSCAFSAIITTI